METLGSLLFLFCTFGRPVVAVDGYVSGIQQTRPAKSTYAVGIHGPLLILSDPIWTVYFSDQEKVIVATREYRQDPRRIWRMGEQVLIKGSSCYSDIERKR